MVNLYRGPERRTSSAGPIIDVLQLMQAPAGMHLEGTHHLYSFVDSARIFTIKGDKGYPWDVRTYDGTYLYNFCTELDWTSPKDYKRVVLAGSVPFAYRYAYNGDSLTTAGAPTHEVVQNCAVTRTFSIGQITHKFVGPVTENIGGDIGTVEVYKVLYQWNGGKVQETFTYAPGFGQVGWQTQNLNASGQYDPPTASSYFNLVRPGTVTPVHPCF